MRVIPLVLAMSLVLAGSGASAQDVPPHHVHLVPQGTDCHTGPHDVTSEPGTAVTLKACVFSQDEAPADTSGGPTSLSWLIDGDATFSSAPPSETDGSGTATASVVLQGDDFADATVTVALCSSNPCGLDSLVDSSSVRLSTIHGDPVCAFNGTNCDGAILVQVAPRRLSAAVGDQPHACMSGRPLVVKKQRAGADRIMRIAQADENGESSLRIPKWWRGRHYVVAPRWEVEYDDSLITCDLKRSPTVFIR